MLVQVCANECLRGHFSGDILSGSSRLELGDILLHTSIIVGWLLNSSTF